MRVLIVALAIATAATPVFAASRTSVSGYTKSNGTYVAPHVRTSPNTTQRDNWSSKPNTNPITGKAGTVTPVK
jgi:hypothetical protein